MKSIGSVIGVILWVMGIILAKGFWSTLFAVCIPLWAWFLSIQHLMVHFGLL